MDLGIIKKTADTFFYPEVHYTDFFEIAIFTEGNGHVCIDTEKIDLVDGTFLFITPFQKRRWFVDRNQLKGYYIIFEKNFLAEFFTDPLFVFRLQYFYNIQAKPYYRSSLPIFPQNQNLLQEIIHELQNYQKDSPHLLRSILYYLLIKMNRAYCQFHQLKNDTQRSNYAYRFKKDLEKNIRQKQQVNEYARLLGISRVSLNKIAKGQFGLTATEIIKDRLIVEIKKELLYTSDSISEIAYKLNFSEANNLTRLFKSKTGTTPFNFRQEHRTKTPI